MFSVHINSIVDNLNKNKDTQSFLSFIIKNEECPFINPLFSDILYKYKFEYKQDLCTDLNYPINENNSWQMAMLGYYYELHNDNDLAIKYYKLANNVFSRYNILRLFFKLKNWKRALMLVVENKMINMVSFIPFIFNFYKFEITNNDLEFIYSIYKNNKDTEIREEIFKLFPYTFICDVFRKIEC